MAEIIRRAVEIQAGKPAGQEGISEDELRAAAVELGIEPGAITAALRSADSTEHTRQDVWGGPFKFDAERVFNGTLSDEQWEETVADLRKTFEDNGTIEQRGSTREWATTGGGVDYKTLTLRQSGDTVRVTATTSFGGLSFLSYLATVPLPMFITAGFLSKVNWGSPAELLTGLGILAAGLLGARQFSAGITRKRRRVIADLLDRIEARLEPSSSDVRQRLVQAPTMPEGKEVEVDVSSPETSDPDMP